MGRPRVRCEVHASRQCGAAELRRGQTVRLRCYVCQARLCDHHRCGLLVVRTVPYEGEPAGRPRQVRVCVPCLRAEARKAGPVAEAQLAHQLAVADPQTEARTLLRLARAVDAAETIARLNRSGTREDEARRRAAEAMV